MSFLTRNEPPAPVEEPADVATGARLIPRITIQAFCEHSQTAQLVEAAIHDRRMSKVALTTHLTSIESSNAPVIFLWEIAHDISVVL